ncbi:MAG: CoA pyrophosphatase [Bacteroidales bacterium]|nr:CoA pyrophosphatase [Bacteroidales bacterium]
MKFIEKLKQNLNRTTLPGYEAHKKMLPKGRVYINDSNFYKESAVNLILFFKSNKLHFILTKRSENLVHHSGQISLPGGAKDLTDKNLWETAKRETFEEIGIDIVDADFVGKLSELYVSVSGYVVHPFVTFLNRIDEFSVNSAEVARVIEVDFDQFFKSSNILKKKISNNVYDIEYPYYKYFNDEVWGLTAMILSEFYEISVCFKQK